MGGGIWANCSVENMEFWTLFGAALVSDKYAIHRSFIQVIDRLMKIYNIKTGFDLIHVG